MYSYKLTENYDDKNQESYQNRPIFVWKLFKKAELRGKIDVIEHNRVITRKNNVSVKFVKKTCSLINCILFLVQYYDY